MPIPTAVAKPLTGIDAPDFAEYYTAEGTEVAMKRLKVRLGLWMGLVTIFCAALGTLGALGSPRAGHSSGSADLKESPFAIEYYYKAKWGHAEEFLMLFKKNHYPVLQREMEMGRILRVSMTAPRLHAAEDGRWDYRVTIVFKNGTVANDDFDSAGLIREMYPDQDNYKKEEQRRFEILDGHWDVPVKEVVLEKN